MRVAPPPGKPGGTGPLVLFYRVVALECFVLFESGVKVKLVLVNGAEE